LTKKSKSTYFLVVYLLIILAKLFTFN